MSSLRLSVLDLVPILEGVRPAAAIENAVKLVRMAEKLGYTRYWVAEHHDMDAIASSCPEVLLAHIGANTDRIRIGSGAVLLPYYKPYKVAEAFHMLATLYPGRVDLGIGRAPGGNAHVSMALADNFLDQVRRMPDSVEALAALLADEFQVEGERVSARPVPDVAPELWLLGTNEKSAQLASRCGAGYCFGQFMSERNGAEVLDAYRGEFRPSGWNAAPRAIVAIGVVCAETDKEAEQIAREGMSAIFGSAGEAASEAAERGAPPRKSVVGSPDRVRSELLSLREAYGVDEFMIATIAPDYATRFRSFELTAKAVLG